MPLSTVNADPRTTLSRQEMCMISQRISRDFSPRLFSSRAGKQQQSRFSPQQLLEISQQISREYAPNKINQPSRLVLLAVSPRRLHAYWHVAKRLLTAALQKSAPTPPMTLRIYTDADPYSGMTEETDRQPVWFDVAVNQVDGQQDICLPAAFSTDTAAHRYRAELGELSADQAFTPWVHSHAAAKPYMNRSQSRIELPEAMAQFIMTPSHPASSAGKTASGQGKSAT